MYYVSVERTTGAYNVNGDALSRSERSGPFRDRGTAEHVAANFATLPTTIRTVIITTKEARR